MQPLSIRLATIAPRAAELAARLPAHAEGELLVKLKPEVDLVSFVGLQQADGISTVERFDFPQVMKEKMQGELLRLRLPEGVSAAEGMALLENDERLAYVSTNELRTVSAEAGDPRRSELWGLDTIQAGKAWEQTTGSRNGPVIAVLDTGLDLTHPDIVANLWTNKGEIPGNGIDDDNNGVIDDVHGYNAVEQTGDPYDDSGHGTHCAGTIGAVGDNAEGVTGVNWQAQIMPVKMMVNNTGTAADTVRALIYATKNGASITSNSYGGPYSQAEYEAFAASPLLHICAAGNEGNDNDVSRFYPAERPIGYPATFELPNIISVAATNQKDRLAGFSNYGAKTVDLAAPGVSILSTVPGGGYETKSGTSMATPHVAGVAALIATAYPEATPDQIKTRLLSNVDPIPALTGKVVTGGRLNAAKALENDVVAPASPTEAKGEASWNSAKLTWNPSGDDGASGVSSFGEVRWTDADGRVMTERLKTPASGSASASAALRLLPSGESRVVDFEVRELDNVANASQPAIVSLEIPAARVAEVAWSGDGEWAQVDMPEQGRSGVWTDSPQGNYAHRSDSSLTSLPFRLEGVDSQLTFESRYRVDPHGDAVKLLVREAGAEEWRQLEEFTSFREWERQAVDLSAYDGKTIELRFRLQSDGTRSDEGISLDRLRVAGKVEAEPSREVGVHPVADFRERPRALAKSSDSPSFGSRVSR